MFCAILVHADGNPVQVMTNPSWHTGDEVCRYFGIEGTNKYAAAGAGFLARSDKWIGFKIMIRPNEAVSATDETGSPFSFARSTE